MKKSQSQNNWLRRQEKDIYVKLSKVEGYRSRAAYKLLEINKKFNIIKSGLKIVDLGSSPGGWTQVISKLQKNKTIIIAIDKVRMEPIPNCKFILDELENFLSKNTIIKKNSFDLILSDMAPSTTGHRFTDQAKSEKTCFMALDFSLKYLAFNGNFVCKIIRNPGEKDFLKETKRNFNEVKLFKPGSSRKNSKENYMIALGFNNLHKV